jgi:lysophospholipase L1-like esterase
MNPDMAVLSRRRFINKVFFVPLFLGSFPLAGGMHQGNQKKMRILIIGDSVSIGYTPYVRELLDGIAEVYHNEGNAEHTGTGLRKLEGWLKEGRWDIIHFNWGLWDICYRHPDSNLYGNRDKINGHVTHTVEQYGQNLEELVKILMDTGAKLIWATTTPVPEGEPGRIEGDERRYNEVAANIMVQNKILINDLHSYMFERMAEFQVAYGDVHFTEKGYEFLGIRVAEFLQKVICNDD